MQLPEQIKASGDDSSNGVPIDKKIKNNIEYFKKLNGDSDDVIIREIRIRGLDAAVFYLEGMVDSRIINDDILKPLMKKGRTQKEKIKARELFLQIVDEVAPVGEMKIVQDFDELTLLFMSGFAAIFLDGCTRVIMLSVQGWEMRAIEQPDIENVIRGPKDSFTETIRTNTTLVRRRIRDPNLRIITTQIGRRSKTDVVLTYIQGIVNPSLLDEIKKRMDTIDIDAIIGSGYVEQLIQDSWWTIFPTIQETERPDRVAAALVEGKAAILVDNTPFALIIPANLNMMMMSPEDSYLRWVGGTIARLIRFGSSFAAMLLPSLYIAFTSYHPEMIPFGLAIAIAINREMLVFPAYVEVFLLELSMELLREAGIRLPGPISQTIGIVGAIVIGTAAVEAGLVGPIVVIIVAFTAISSFVVPTVSLGIAIRQLRFVFMIAATVLGIYGVMLGLLALLGHLATLKSFGVDYLSPFAPLRIRDLKDTIIRMPLPSMHTRPLSLKTQDPDRMDDERQDDLQRGTDSDKY